MTNKRTKWLIQNHNYRKNQTPKRQKHNNNSSENKLHNISIKHELTATTINF